MKKTYSLVNLECAHCAAKMETAIRKIEGVSDVTVSYIAQRLTIEAPDAVFESVLAQAAKVIRKIEPDCVIKR